jgi:hypothetical protein
VKRNKEYYEQQYRQQRSVYSQIENQRDQNKPVPKITVAIYPSKYAGVQARKILKIMASLYQNSSLIASS